MGLRERLFGKKKEVVEAPEEWVEDKTMTVKKVDVGQVPLVKVEYEGKRKIRIPGLRRGKQVLSVILFLLNVMFGISSLGMWNLYISTFFFSNSFMLLDHLWKMRHTANVWKQEEE